MCPYKISFRYFCWKSWGLLIFKQLFINSKLGLIYIVFKSTKSQAMKGFGNNDKTNKKSTEKRVKSSQKDELIFNALSLHSNGKLRKHFKNQIILING